MKKYIINSENGNMRLDKALSILDNALSRSIIQKQLENGDVLVNGKREKASYMHNWRVDGEPSGKQRGRS